ncbi:MAG: diaminopropionate ammonia-lyase [Ruminococcaceae bacterium]|nr:diaminopropionate ammonia-lyase [Oscillospiraceae bacterium]
MKEYKVSDVSVIVNDNKSSGAPPQWLNEKTAEKVYRIHSTLPIYEPTPLVKLDTLAEKLALKAVCVKDESKRFGLNAFKGLGGLYALTMVVSEKLGLDADTITFADLKKEEYKDKIQQMVFVTATDGNHGKGVAWAAGQLGCEAHVYMPVGSSLLRAQAIRDAGRAEAVITDMNYDDTVRYAAKMAQENGWYLVQDTSWENYEKIPQWIAQGYSTMAKEACDSLDNAGLKPTHVFLQAGVGAMAGGVLGYIAHRYNSDRPYFAVVEPENIACIYHSAMVGDGAPHAAEVQKDTIMAGLNCGEPCPLTWTVLRDFADFYITCPDKTTENGMRLLAKPCGNDTAVISGESGAVTTGLTAQICGDEKYASLKKLLNLDENSVVLCFSTEGDTDPVNYRKIVWGE